MKKKLVMLVLASFIMTLACSFTVYADDAVVSDEAVSVYGAVYIDPYNTSYAPVHSLKEEKLQKTKNDVNQFKSDLKVYRQKIKLIQKEQKKSKKNYTLLKKCYKNAEKCFKKADADLTVVLEDLDVLGDVYCEISWCVDPDMGYDLTSSDLEQIESDLAEIKEYKTKTKEYLQQFEKGHQVNSDTFGSALKQAKRYIDFAIKTKNSKKIKTKQKLDNKAIKHDNEYEGYESSVKYGIYDDEDINAEIKAFDKYRKDKKLPAMKHNIKLNKAAAMLAMEYTIGADSSAENHIRPDGTRYSTAIKECGVKCKSSSLITITYIGGRYSSFVDDVVNTYSSMYGEVINSREYTEYGIGYYAYGDGSLQRWVLIPISK